MLEGLRDGTIDCIATDHAPHTVDDKKVEYDQAAFGIVGLETAVGLCLDRLVRARPHRPRAARAAALGRARAASLGLPGGTLAPGRAGRRHRARPRTASGAWTPRASRARGATRRSAAGRCTGAPALTIVAGRVVWRAGQPEDALSTAPQLAEPTTGCSPADPARGLEQAAWLEQAFRDAGVTFDGAPMRTFLRPHLSGAAEWDALRDDGRRLLELAARVARHAFGGDVAPAVRVPGHAGGGGALGRASIPGPPDVVLSRLDAFLDGRRPALHRGQQRRAGGLRLRRPHGRGVRASCPRSARFAAAHRVRYHAVGARAGGRGPRPPGARAAGPARRWSPSWTGRR